MIELTNEIINRINEIRSEISSGKYDQISEQFKISNNVDTLGVDIILKYNIIKSPDNETYQICLYQPSITNNFIPDYIEGEICNTFKEAVESFRKIKNEKINAKFYKVDNHDNVINVELCPPPKPKYKVLWESPDYREWASRYGTI